MGIGPNVQVLTFPSDDRVFALRVHEIVQRLPRSDPDTTMRALHEALVPVHPAVSLSVRSRDAGYGSDPVVYVFRDGSALPRFDGREPASADVARVVTDDSGVYVDADENAVTLFGVPCDEILGAPAGTFTKPDARIANRDALWRALQETGRLHSLAVVQRADGTEIPVEFVTTRDGAGPGRHLTLIWPLP